MLGRRQAGLVQHPAERAAVLGEVDGLGRGADDRHALGLERLGQAERGLPAELHDDAGDRAGEALGVHHLEHVLEGERLEVEPAARVVVGRDRLGVAVDHHRVVAGVAQGEAGVHAGVVELDALADPVGAGAEDEHRRALARGDLVLLVVGAVVVRRQRGELGRAGVDRLVDRAHAEGVAHPADDRLRHPAQRRDLGVAEAVPLGQPEQVGVEAGGVGDGIRDVLDERHLVEEPRVDAGGLVHLLDRQPAAQRLLHEHDPAVGGAAGLVEERAGLARSSGAVAVPVEAAALLLERAQRLLQRLGERCGRSTSPRRPTSSSS